MARAPNAVRHCRRRRCGGRGCDTARQIVHCVPDLTTARDGRV
jgi:hypothetical protein